MIHLLDYNNWFFLNEINSETILYHRSPEKFKAGDILDISKMENLKGVPHFRKNNTFELALDEFRKKYFPNTISRIDCIYASPYKKSRFMTAGKLYAIKPIGNKYLVTDSDLIDKMMDNFIRFNFNYDSEEINYKYLADMAIDDRYAYQYFKGANISKDMKKSIEVLLEKAEVLYEIDDKTLISGTVFVVNKDEKINIELNTKYANDTIKNMVENKIKKYYKKIDNQLYLVKGQKYILIRTNLNYSSSDSAEDRKQYRKTKYMRWNTLIMPFDFYNNIEKDVYYYCFSYTNLTGNIDDYVDIIDSIPAGEINKFYK